MTVEEVRAKIKWMIDLMAKQKAVDVVVALYWVLAMVEMLETTGTEENGTK